MKMMPASAEACTSPWWTTTLLPNVPHGVLALEGSDVVSAKSVLDGVGHRI